MKLSGRTILHDARRRLFFWRTPRTNAGAQVDDRSSTSSPPLNGPGWVLRAALILSFAVGCVMFGWSERARSQTSEEEDRNAPPLNQQEYAQKLRLAEVYEETRDAQNAARIYLQLYHTNPSDETVFDGLTRSLIYLKRYDEAEKLVSEKLATVGSLDVLLLYARLEARVNKRPQSIEAFQKAEAAVNAKDCSQLFPIVYAMMDVSYNQDALELLDRMRKLASRSSTSDDADICSSQIAGLYLRLGEFDRASTEFLNVLKEGEGNVGMVEQRLAQYMTDSLSRSTVLGALESEVLKVPPTRANLQLLAWLYGEKKDYKKALTTMIKLDDLPGDSKGSRGAQPNDWSVAPHDWSAAPDRGSQGFALLQFADRARNEGALNVAVEAYHEAISRLKSGSGSQQRYFIAQAELGALKTTETYYLSQSMPQTNAGSHPSPPLNGPGWVLRAAPKDSIEHLVSQFEVYAAPDPMNEFTFEALVHAGNLSFNQLFDLNRAAKDFESVLAHAQGMSENARTAAFGLVDIAIASENWPLAESRLQAIEERLVRNPSPRGNDVRDRIQFERALSDYYQMNFDSSLAKLETVAEDAGSDYANDAISLSGLIQENNNPAGLEALRLYARAALAENERKFELANAGYDSIVRTMSNSALADDAAIRSSEMQVELGRPLEATHILEKMQETMLTSPLLDQAAFREAEIVEHDLHDRAKAQKLYEDFLARYPNSIFTADARDRARKLRGDALQ